MYVIHVWLRRRICASSLGERYGVRSVESRPAIVSVTAPICRAFGTMPMFFEHDQLHEISHNSAKENQQYGSLL